jgi:hypothetical protein
VAERATQRLRKRGYLFCKRYWRERIEQRLKLQWYYGGQWVAYLPSKEGMIIVAAGNLDEAFDQQLAYLDPSERRERILLPVDPWNDACSLILS